MKRTTIKDIAKALQVSNSTISRALKNHPDISDEMKQKVRETADLMNYIPNQFAVNFRNNASKVIGLIIPDMSMFFIPSIIQGISEVLTEKGYRLFILPSNESYQREKENITTCINSSVDGVMISLSQETQDLEHLKKLKALEIPVIIFDRTLPQNGFEEVVFDNERKIKDCAQKLIDNECLNIMAIFGNKDLEITKSRYQTFKTEIEKYPNISLHTIFCDSAPMVKKKLTPYLTQNQYDGFFAMSDETLAGLNITLIDNSINTNDVKVVCISEGILPSYLNRNYEFVKNDGKAMGKKTVNLLLEKIEARSSN